mmetsp:Transcript_42555/g.101282  ORF Transcript_42555/g.101282 Transcript_42555/m.101282 type:complete len:295 (-) Transcript_42555:77-961(-)
MDAYGAAPAKIVSNSGKVYQPLSRPSTGSSRTDWRPSTTAPGGRAGGLGAPSASKNLKRNPRYDNVQPRTDSGNNMKRVEERFGLSSFRYKREELFARVKASKLAEQMEEHGLADVLLLDLREKSEFDEWHIQGAVNYPACMMSRSMYQFTPEILDFKNKDGKLMVLYDVGEKLSVAVGTNWFEKGIDNFVVLSGGMGALAQKHAHLIEGSLPAATLARPLTASPAKSSRAGRGSQPAQTFLSLTQQRPMSAGIASAASAPVSGMRPARWTALRQSAGFSGASFYSQASVSMDR